ncbi:HTH domain-containing protein [Staphylococcus saprophyticus]|uniref:HTH domain-containing protein n=1 Tax=Staphylococcus saprophyticus TaxID=29385 RepID=UPI0030BC9CE1
MLSKRQYHILMFILECETFVQIHHLATHFNVTERTIQYDLEYIEDMASNLGLIIQRTKQEGVKITTTPEQLKRFAHKSTTHTIHYAKEERLLYITLKLLEANTPTSSQVLAITVSVSRRTIVEDLKSVQNWLEQHDYLAIAECAFVDLAHLNKVFKYRYGVTAYQYMSKLK